MSWTEDTTSGVLTKTGTDREVYSSTTPSPGNFAQIAQPSLPSDNVKCFAFGTYDGRNCWEGGIQGANVIIRQVSFATAAAASATAAHGLTAGVPFEMEMRVVERTISVFLNGATVAAVTYEIPANNDKLGFRGYGLVGTVNNTRVVSFEIGELVPAVLVRNKIFCAVAAGRLFASIDGDTLREIARGVARETGYVCLVEYRARVYIFDGQKGRIFDPVTLTVTNTPDGLPGSAGVGTTTIYQAVTHFARLYAYTVDDPQNLYASRLNDGDDWDTADDTAGHAFTLPIARAGLAGQVIRCINVAGGNALAIGCGSSAWALQGDPARGQINLMPLSLSVGASGPTSMYLADEGFVLMHGPAGLSTVQAGGLSSVNDLVLTEGIQYDPEDRDDFTVSVVRDPLHKLVWVFMRRAEGESLHFAYSERVGGFTRDGGGMFPVAFPDGMNPTAAIVWDSKVLIGCEDGYIRTLDYSTDADFDGEDIESYCPFEQVNEPEIENDTILTRLYLVLASWSDPVHARVWRGQTPEQAFDPDIRALGYDRTLQWHSAGGAPGAITQPVRAPCVVVEMYAASGRWGVEAMETTTEVAQITTRHAWPVRPAPGSLCTFPGAGSSGTGTASTGLATGPGFTGTGLGSGTGSGTGTGTPPGTGSGTIPVGTGTGTFFAYDIDGKVTEV